MSLLADVSGVLVLLILLFLMRSADREDVVLEVDVDVFLVKSGKLSLKYVVAVLLHHIRLEAGEGFLQIAVVKKCREEGSEIFKRISPKVAVSCKDCRCKHI